MFMDLYRRIVDYVHDFLVRIGVDAWLTQVGVQSYDVIHVLFAGGLGICAGLLCKKCFKIVFWVALVTLVLVFFLEYKKVLAINWPGINVLLGFDSTTTVDAMVNSFFDSVKNNALITISALIGFLIGLRIG